MYFTLFTSLLVAAYSIIFAAAGMRARFSLANLFSAICAAYNTTGINTQIHTLAKRVISSLACDDVLYAITIIHTIILHNIGVRMCV